MKIYVCSHPRSGTTWLMRLLSDALDSPIDSNGTLEWWGSKGGNYSIIKAHIMYVPTDGKCVFIYRDPRDVCVSIYHYRHVSSIYDTLVKMSVVNDPTKDHIGPYQNLVRFWFNTGKAHSQTSYEALFYNGVRELQRVVNDLIGIELPIRKIAMACNRNSFWGIRTRFPDRDPHAMRKGIVGDWEKHFRRSDGELCQKLFGNLMMEQGYIDSAEWWKTLPDG